MRHLVLILVTTLVVAATSMGQFGLPTSFERSNVSDGNMFDITTERDILITGLDVNIGAPANAVEIWTITAGTSYVGSENTPGDWTLVETVPVNANGINQITHVSLSAGINMTAGQTLGFYVTLNNNGGRMWYTTGTSLGGPAAQDHTITITEGVGKNYPFGTTFGNTTTSRIWSGRVFYDIVSTLDLGAAGGIGQDGAMFDIVSTVPVDLRGIDAHLAAGVHDVEVYITNSGSLQGKTMAPNQWKLIGSATVNSNGQGTLSHVPFLFSERINGTRGLYVTTTVGTNTRYQSGSNFGGVLLDDGVVSVLAGIGKAYPFLNDVGNPTPGGTSRLWNGRIRYSLPPLLSINETFDDVPGLGSDVPPLGWLQDLNDVTGANSDWLFRDDSPTSLNGPSSDNTSGMGNFAHTEDSGSAVNHPAINLLTRPVVVATGNCTLEFFVNSNAAGSSQNPLAVDVIEQPSGIVHRDIVLQIGSTGGTWTPVRACLTPWLGVSVQVQFRGRTDNNTFTNDVGIDDVRISSTIFPVAAAGQGPQPGLATLDINDAGDAARCLPVSFAAPGPYYAISHPGETLDITIESEPAVPVLFFAGNLNPGLLPLGAIGQLDIGDPGLSGLVVIGDGNATDFFNSLWRTSSAGELALSLPTPAALTGFALAFQGITFNSSPSAISLTNAVEVTVIP